MSSEPPEPFDRSDEEPVTPEVVEAAEARGSPWGFWATVGLSLVVLFAFGVIQTAVGIPFAMAEMQRRPGLASQELIEELESNGLFFSLATFLSATACTALTVLLAGLRPRISVRDYLGLKEPGPGAILGWGLLLVGFMLASDGLTYLAGRDVVPQQMIDVYQTAGFLPLLLLAVIGLAPMFEEIFFRGFLFVGIENSRLGGVGAIVITALIWAGIHMQYNVYQATAIFVGGLLLGAARLRTGSVYLAIGMHALWNAIAMVETAIAAGS